MKKRVLQITGMLQNGGTEAVVMNYYRHIDREEVQFDFLTYASGREHYSNEVESLGGRIFYIPSKKSPVKCFAGLLRLGKRYDTVHFHTASALCWFELLALRMAGVKTIIGHSHSTTNHSTTNLSGAKNRLQAACRPLFSALCDYRFACSNAAGEWLFGRKAFAKSGRVIPNAIDLDKFRFNEAVRSRIRERYEIGQSLLIGHVGRFCYLKNQAFLIEILETLLKSGIDAKLMLIGWGEDEGKIKAIVHDRGFDHKVLLMGARSDVHELLQAMDVFVLPSRHEGLGIALVEARASGLPCVYSDAAPPEVGLSGFMSPLSLKEPPAVWAAGIERLWQTGGDRESGVMDCAKAGYSITEAAKILERFYTAENRKGAFV